MEAFQSVKCTLDRDDYASELMKRGLSKFPPLIVTCAITGANQGKESNPNLPESIEEQVQQTYDAYNAGASIVHIHGRGPEPEQMGYNTTRPEVYKEINARVRERCPDLIINNTIVCGRWWTSDGKISEPTAVAMSARPEIGSIDVTNYGVTTVKRKRPAPLRGIDEDYQFEANYAISDLDMEAGLNQMKRNGIKPEFEMFGLQDIHYLRTALKKGLADTPLWASMIFGALFNYPAPEVLLATMDMLPRESMLNVIATGACQFPFLTQAILLGCHVRVGMEDNIYISRGQLASGNAQMVEKIVRIARELGRPIATPQQAREMLGLDAPRAYTL